jgi:hypothetical protein
VSNESQSFNEICRDVRGEDLKKDFIFSRNKDKTDKSLQIYKFYINTLCGFDSCSGQFILGGTKRSTCDF